jgi:metallo-beta-lactamase family protein
MPRLTFYGATGTVTGSRFLLEIQNKKLLIDCGLFQGLKKNRLRNWEAFPVPPPEIDALLLTHAHIDHSGYIPRLVKYGFASTIYCTYATKELCEIMLLDTAHLQEEDALWANKKGFSKHDPALPLYTIDEAKEALKQFHAVYYGEDYFLTENLRIKFKDAGHILGSAFVDIKTAWDSKMRRILFSGDIGRPDQPILRNPRQAYNIDYLIIESTYGDRLHTETAVGDDLAAVINRSIERGGILVIPSFAVGRTQTLLYTIRELEEQQKIPILPVYVDSPMAIDATSIFENHKGDYDYQAKISELRGKKILKPRLLHVCRDREKSKAINTVKNRAIIISASGMVAGGRILHHMQQRLPEEQHTILFIGYQAEGTRGRAILEGKETIKIHGQHVPVKAQIENMTGFSAHADYNEILAWLMGFNRPPEMTFLVHGEPEASEALAQRIKDHLHWPVTVPAYEASFDLA